MGVSDLDPGDSYVPKFETTVEVVIQIGMGGDCGVFKGLATAQTFKEAPLFRVIVQQKDLRRHWKKVGHFPLGSTLAEFGTYSQNDFRTTDYYKVNLGNPDERIKIEKSEFENIELLAVWETEHIKQKLNDFLGQGLFP